MTSKFKFQLEFSRIIFLIFYLFMMIFSYEFSDFLTYIFISEIFVKSIYFYGYSRNFFVKFRLFFESRVLGKFSLTSVYQVGSFEKSVPQDTELATFPRSLWMAFWFWNLISRKTELFFHLCNMWNGILNFSRNFVRITAGLFHFNGL